MRSSRYWILAFSIVAGIVAETALAATSFDVGASGMSAYVIGGANNPTLTLTRGQTYTFNVTVGGHPFWITTAPGAGDAQANQFSTGVTNNGASPGVVTFVVPASAPPLLYYQCSFHDPMFGRLNIVAAASVPAVGPVATVALGGLLLAAYALAGAARAGTRTRSRRRAATTSTRPGRR